MPPTLNVQPPPPSPPAMRPPVAGAGGGDGAFAALLPGQPAAGGDAVSAAFGQVPTDNAGDAAAPAADAPAGKGSNGPLGSARAKDPGSKDKSKGKDGSGETATAVPGVGPGAAAVAVALPIPAGPADTAQIPAGGGRASSVPSGPAARISPAIVESAIAAKPIVAGTGHAVGGISGEESQAISPQAARRTHGTPARTTMGSGKAAASNAIAIASRGDDQGRLVASADMSGDSSGVAGVTRAAASVGSPASPPGRAAPVAAHAAGEMSGAPPPVGRPAPPSAAVGQVPSNSTAVTEVRGSAPVVASASVPQTDHVPQLATQTAAAPPAAPVPSPPGGPSAALGSPSASAGQNSPSAVPVSSAGIAVAGMAGGAAAAAPPQQPPVPAGDPAVPSSSAASPAKSSGHDAVLAVQAAAGASRQADAGAGSSGSEGMPAVGGGGQSATGAASSPLPAPSSAAPPLSASSPLTPTAAIPPTPASAAASAPAATATPVAVATLAQFAGVVVARVGRGATAFDIRLDPPELGPVAVRLSIGRDGRVSSHFTVDSPEALNALRSDLPNLQTAFQQAGLKSEPGSTSFQLRGDGGGGWQPPAQQQHAQPQWQPAVRTAAPAPVLSSAAVPLTPLSRSRAAAGGLDILI